MYIHVSYLLGYDIKEHSLRLTSREGNCIRTGPRTPLLYCARCTADRAQYVDMMKSTRSAVLDWHVLFAAHDGFAVDNRDTRVWLWLVGTLTLTLTILYDNSQRVKFSHSRCHSLKPSTPLVWGLVLACWCVAVRLVLVCWRAAMRLVLACGLGFMCSHFVLACCQFKLLISTSYYCRTSSSMSNLRWLLLPERPEVIKCTFQTFAVKQDPQSFLTHLAIRRNVRDLIWSITRKSWRCTTINRTVVS